MMLKKKKVKRSMEDVLLYLKAAAGECGKVVERFNSSTDYQSLEDMFEFKRAESVLNFIGQFITFIENDGADA